MKRTWILIACLGGVAAILPIFAQQSSHWKAGQQAQIQSDRSPSPTNSSEGERVFKDNCSRCHDAPQGFPPQISGTVIRHMRVRASLSERDEKQIMAFLNP